jgi:hypothetical protein
MSREFDLESDPEFQALPEELRTWVRTQGWEHLRPIQRQSLKWFRSTGLSAACDLVVGAPTADPPPLKWSNLRYVFDIKEDCNGKEAIQA